MAFVICNQGSLIALEALINKTAPQTIEMKLFENDYTPVQGSTEANFTEATFTGYAKKTLTGSGWTSTPGDPADVAPGAQTFTSSAGSQNKYVYGFYLVQATSGKLIGAERFSEAVHIVNNGDNVVITFDFQS